MQRREFLSAIASGVFLATVGCAERRAAASPEDLALLDVIDQAALIESGEVSAIEVIEAAIARIERINPELNAIVTEIFDQARKRVRHGRPNRSHWARREIPGTRGTAPEDQAAVLLRPSHRAWSRRHNPVTAEGRSAYHRRNAAFSASSPPGADSRSILRPHGPGRSRYGTQSHADVARTVEEAALLFEELGHEIVVTEQTPLADPAAIEHFLIHWASWAAGIVDDVEQRTGKSATETGLLEPWTIGLADYFHAQPAYALPNAVKEFRVTTERVTEFFEQFDAWLTPVTATPPPRLGEQAPTQKFDPLLERVSRFAAYTPIHNVAGTPAMSVPFGMSADGLPIGVQLFSRVGAEALLLEIAYQVEQARPWVGELPAVHA